MGQYFISFSAKMSVRIRSLHRLSMRAAFSTVAANAQPKVSIDLKQIEPFVDFKQPSKWYPSARNFRRHIICHVGPTNSGKTFAALKKITDAPGIRGIYCAPLRLLAIEVYNKFNKNHKIPCALRTGEISCGPGDSNEFAPSDWSAAPLLSCTVEMADINRPYDIAIIDEIQMMADTQRGWAFTQALLGLQAREIYVCGEESAVPIIKAIAEEIGDTVEIVHFNRLSPLQLSEASLGNKLDRIRPGDCVVAFSRREIFDLKYLIERQTNRKCAVVYGNLPMESRSEQARLFNEPSTGYDILVASDAIGMGLNLNIKRIVFKTMVKYNGTETEPIPSNQVKQIAGRAGRYGTLHEAGLLTTYTHEMCHVLLFRVNSLHSKDMKYLKRCISIPNTPIPGAGLLPTADHIVNLSHLIRGVSLPEIIRIYQDHVLLDKKYFLCHFKDLQKMAELLEKYPELSIKDRFQLACAPVKTANMFVVSSFDTFVKSLAKQEPCPLKISIPTIKSKPENALQLAESVYRSLDLYLWLGTHFPNHFIQTKEALTKREECALVVSKALEMICHVRENRKKRQNIPQDTADGLHSNSIQVQPYRSLEDIGISSVGIDDIEKVISDLEKTTSQEPGDLEGK